MSTAPRTPGAADLRADLLADLAGPHPLPGHETALPSTFRRQIPALELRLTPTRWAVVRRTRRGVKVGPWTFGVSRD
jgi:hypothetical protein